MARRSPLLLLVAALLTLPSPASGAASLRVAQHQAVKRAGRAAASDSGGGRLIAPPRACPAQEDLAAGTDAQQGSMRCMIDFARERAGLAPLSDSAQLDSSAQAKAGDLLACDRFSHDACGREFTYWMRESGYLTGPCWHVGENLAWGSGAYGTVRSIFRAWMRSPEHRLNILGDYAELGLDLTVGSLEGHAAAHVWAAHFGSHCESQGR
jgi:uncharacterized protein YkwD